MFLVFPPLLSLVFSRDDFFFLFKALRCAGLSVYFNSFYVGGGVFFLKEPEVSFYFKTGYDFGGWEWGPGTGSVYLGLIVSPTLVSFDSDGSTEGNIDAAVGSFFGSLLNMLKIECGVRYYIPF